MQIATSPQILPVLQCTIDVPAQQPRTWLYKRLDFNRRRAKTPGPVQSCHIPAPRPAHFLYAQPQPRVQLLPARHQVPG